MKVCDLQTGSVVLHSNDSSPECDFKRAFSPAMAFPQTRHTLIQRLASGGSDDDWQDFLNDYWGPICRFALGRNCKELADAEDVAASTFEVLLRNDLLQRWISSKRAKLRTLLCGVVCKIQANQFRADQKKKMFEREFGDQLIQETIGPERGQQVDAFMAAWAEDLLHNTLQILARDYHMEGKGDYFRVLYGRLCEGLSIAEVAESLSISTSNVDNYFRHVRARLTEKLAAEVRTQVFRYCEAHEAEAEYEAEWERLGSWLSNKGGLEKAIQQAYALLDGPQLQANKPVRIKETLTRIKLPPEQTKLPAEQTKLPPEQ